MGIPAEQVDKICAELMAADDCLVAFYVEGRVCYHSTDNPVFESYLAEMIRMRVRTRLLRSLDAQDRADAAKEEEAK